MDELQEMSVSSSQGNHTFEMSAENISRILSETIPPESLRGKENLTLLGESVTSKLLASPQLASALQTRSPCQDVSILRNVSILPSFSARKLSISRGGNRYLNQERLSIPLVKTPPVPVKHREDIFSEAPLPVFVGDVSEHSPTTAAVPSPVEEPILSNSLDLLVQDTTLSDCVNEATEPPIAKNLSMMTGPDESNLCSVNTSDSSILTPKCGLIFKKIETTWSDFSLAAELSLDSAESRDASFSTDSTFSMPNPWNCFKRPISKRADPSLSDVSLSKESSLAEDSIASASMNSSILSNREQLFKVQNRNTSDMSLGKAPSSANNSIVSACNSSIMSNRGPLFRVQRDSSYISLEIASTPGSDSNISTCSNNSSIMPSRGKLFRAGHNSDTLNMSLGMVPSSAENSIASTSNSSILPSRGKKFFRVNDSASSDMSLAKEPSSVEASSVSACSNDSSILPNQAGKLFRVLDSTARGMTLAQELSADSAIAEEIKETPGSRSVDESVAQDDPDSTLLAVSSCRSSIGTPVALKDRSVSMESSQDSSDSEKTPLPNELFSKKMRKSTTFPNISKDSISLLASDRSFSSNDSHSPQENLFKQSKKRGRSFHDVSKAEDSHNESNQSSSSYASNTAGPLIRRRSKKYHDSLSKEPSMEEHSSPKETPTPKKRSSKWKRVSKSLADFSRVEDSVSSVTEVMSPRSISTSDIDMEGDVSSRGNSTGKFKKAARKSKKRSSSESTIPEEGSPPKIPCLQTNNSKESSCAGSDSSKVANLPEEMHTENLDSTLTQATVDSGEADLEKTLVSGSNEPLNLFTPISPTPRQKKPFSRTSRSFRNLSSMSDSLKSNRSISQRSSLRVAVTNNLFCRNKLDGTMASFSCAESEESSNSSEKSSDNDVSDESDSSENETSESYHDTSKSDLSESSVPEDREMNTVPEDILHADELNKTEDKENSVLSQQNLQNDSVEKEKESSFSNVNPVLHPPASKSVLEQSKCSINTRSRASSVAQTGVSSESSTSQSTDVNIMSSRNSTRKNSTPPSGSKNSTSKRSGVSFKNQVSNSERMSSPNRTRRSSTPSRGFANNSTSKSSDVSFNNSRSILSPNRNRSSTLSRRSTNNSTSKSSDVSFNNQASNSQKMSSPNRTRRSSTPSRGKRSIRHGSNLLNALAESCDSPEYSSNNSVSQALSQTPISERASLFKRRRPRDSTLPSFSFAESDSNVEEKDSTLDKEESSEEETSDKESSSEDESNEPSKVNTSSSSVDKSIEASKKDTSHSSSSVDDDTEHSKELVSINTTVKGASSADKTVAEESDDELAEASNFESRIFSPVSASSASISSIDQTCVPAHVNTAPGDPSTSFSKRNAAIEKAIEIVNAYKRELAEDRVKALTDPYYKIVVQIRKENGMKEEEKRNWYKNLAKLPVKTVKKAASPRVRHATVKLYKPAHWANKRLYDYLKGKLLPQYGLDHILQAEALVKELYITYNKVVKSESHQQKAVDRLKRKLAEDKIIVTTYDFYAFVSKFMPRDFEKKVIPMVQPFNNRVWPPRNSNDKESDPILK